jgi:hypothetical protein
MHGKGSMRYSLDGGLLERTRFDGKKEMGPWEEGEGTTHSRK